MKNHRHIVITGGHHNSALVIASKLKTLGHEVTWLGHRYASSGDQNDSAEYREVTAAGIKFYELKAGKFGTSFSIQNILNIPLGFFRALHILIALKPDAILSFGSYLGLAVTLAGYFKKIPVFLHEQTVVAGKANLIASHFAIKTYLTWESSQKYFPKKDTLVVGLPLRPSILLAKPTKLFDNSLPTILILGGKLGSHIINQTILAHLPQLLTRYNLIHQTGTSSATGDLVSAVQALAALPAKLAKRYHPVGYINDQEIGPLLAGADLYLGRSGAHITYELAVLGLRSVLIPYLHTHSREQLKNAHILEKAGISRILPESSLTYEALTKALNSALQSPPPPALALPRDSAAVLVRDLLTMLE